MSFSFFGVSFYGYGLIIGIAILVGVWLIEKKAKEIDFSPHSKEYSESTILWYVFGSLIGGVIGARMWHVATDFHIYRNSLFDILYISNGGLSIFGGIVGGAIGLALTIFCLRKIKNKKNIFILINTYGDSISNTFKHTFFAALDLVVFGLPFAQAIGRFANYVNQELYGLPSTVPWAITIDAKNRLLGYEKIATYHPLFLYESIAMLAFGLFVWKRLKWSIGSGKFALLYIWYYSGVRFLLEFIRIDKSTFTAIPGISFIGVNQLIMFFVFVVTTIWWIVIISNSKNKKKSNEKK